MSRSGYTDDCENLGLYRGMVERSMAGRRGQAFLRELEATLLAMPERRLERQVFVSSTGCCAMGAVALARGVDMVGLDVDEPRDAAKLLGISPSMAAEIAFENDDHDGWAGSPRTPEERWSYMLDWTRTQLREAPSELRPRGHCSWCCHEFELRGRWCRTFDLATGEIGLELRAPRVRHHKWLGETCPGAGVPPRPLPERGCAAPHLDDLQDMAKAREKRRRVAARWRTTRTRPGVVRELWRDSEHLATIEVIRAGADVEWRLEIGDQRSERGPMTIGEAESAAKAAAIEQEASQA